MSSLIDLHTHSVFSDGELIPAELAQRAWAAGYNVLAITDHVDHSNLDFIVPRIVKVCLKITQQGNIQALPGVEITHVPPADIPSLADEARKLGAQIVTVHGETIVEPVPQGTNFAAVQSAVDILAHPGLITEEEVQLAVKNGVFLEITTRKGHSFTNGHVAQMARKFKANLVLNNDAHAPSDFVGEDMAKAIAYGAGLNDDEVFVMMNNSRRMVEKISL
jgi:histidinol phosphatase-like PHP family hydrolase